MATTSSIPTISTSTGVDTISAASAVDTVAHFYYGSDLRTAYLPYAQEAQSSNPSTLVTTIDADGSLTHYHGNFIRNSTNASITTGSIIQSFDGTNAKGVQQFSFSTSKGYDALALKQAVQNNDTATFFNIIFSGNDSIVGSSQDDVLSGYAGNNTIDGGAGNDTVFFSGLSTDYSVTQLSNGSTLVKNIKTNETNTLVNVETLQFSDKFAQVPVATSPVVQKYGAVVTALSSLDMSPQHNILPDNTPSITPNLITISGSSGTVQFKGSFNTSTTGTVTGTVNSVTGTTLGAGNSGNYEIKLGSANDAAMFDKFIRSNDAQGLFNYAFSGNDTINGSTGNDTLSGYAGNDTINGGGGTDTVFFSGNYADYQITPTASYVTVQNIKTNETDQLTNIASLQFADKTIPTPTLTPTPVVTLPKVSVLAKQSSVTEGANLIYTVNLDKAATSDLTIPYTLSGTATSADYTGGTGSVTIPKGSTSVNVSLTTKDDGIAEPGGETVIFTLGSITGATVTTPSATATIFDKVVLPTGGNTITLTSPNALVNATTKTNATDVTTSSDDKITSTVANLAGATIDGGAGNDTLTLSDVAGTTTPLFVSNIHSTIPTTSYSGSIVMLTNVETLQLANGSNNVVLGILGDQPVGHVQTIKGGTGDDIIANYYANSSIDGGAGNDTIFIGGNNDTVTGGSGKDIFSVVATTATDVISGTTITDFISGTDKLNLAGILIPVSTTTTSTSSTSSIIGAWKATTPLGDAIATFLSDGTYFYADPNGGAERGTYSWDSAKSTFSVTGNTFDTSSLGFYPSSTATAVSFSGNTASWSVQGIKITAAPITDSAKQIVGSWYAKGLGKAGGDSVFTFLSDGTYYIVDNGDPILDSSGKKGMEKGTYTWNASTGSFSITGTTVNNDGQWGFSDIGNSALTATVTGNTLSFTGIGTLTKVATPTTAPTTTTTLTAAPIVFDGNKATLADAQSAIVKNASKLQVVYEQDTHTLWADVNNDGKLDSSDLQIKLNGVTTLSAADFV